MARSSPEKLAAALRANLKRRKQGARDTPRPPHGGDSAESVPGTGEDPPRPSSDPRPD
jgi:hypothetical protein